MSVLSAASPSPANADASAAVAECWLAMRTSSAAQARSSLAVYDNGVGVNATDGPTVGLEHPTSANVAPAKRTPTAILFMHDSGADAQLAATEIGRRCARRVGALVLQGSEARLMAMAG